MTKSNILISIILVTLIFTVVAVIAHSNRPEIYESDDYLYLESCSNCLRGTHNAVGKPITMHVIFLENMQAVQDKAYMFGYEFHNTQGFAHWQVTDKGVDCTVYTIHPRESNGPNTLVLGHEVLHCVLGEHHD